MSWRDLGALLALVGTRRSLLNESTASRTLLGICVSVSRSHLQRGMTQQCHDVHLVHSLGPQTSRKRVTQIVKPESGDPRLFTCSFPRVPERCQLQACAGVTKNMLV